MPLNVYLLQKLLIYYHKYLLNSHLLQTNIYNIMYIYIINIIYIYIYIFIIYKNIYNIFKNIYYYNTGCFP